MILSLCIWLCHKYNNKHQFRNFDLISSKSELVTMLITLSFTVRFYSNYCICSFQNRHACSKCNAWCVSCTKNESNNYYRYLRCCLHDTIRVKICGINKLKHVLPIDTPSLKNEPIERGKPWRCWDILQWCCIWRREETTTKNQHEGTDWHTHHNKGCDYITLGDSFSASLSVLLVFLLVIF